MEEPKQQPVKAKAKIPFPPMKAPAVAKEEPSQISPDEEITAQQIAEAEERQKAMIGKISCRHQISTRVLAKSGMLMCGNCRQAMFVGGQWFELDEQYPEDWKA